MKTIIIEDELLASQMLQNTLRKIDPNIEVVAVLQTIEEVVEWFETPYHPSVDLVFMDIHLSDGSSFEIFDKTTISCPVIFTTAYDEYALKAFEVNSIDYLLKPVGLKELERALSKYKNLTQKPYFAPELLNELIASIKADKLSNRSNFLIPYKDKLIPLSVDKIAFVYFENKLSHIHTYNGEIFSIDKPLEELYRQLDTNRFFRANRQYIIAHKAIKDISLWFNSKLSVNLTVDIPEKIIISRLRATEFKEWYTRK